MAVQKKVIQATTEAVEKKGGVNAKHLKKPSTRDTLKKATLAKKSSAASSSTKKPVARKLPAGKNKPANKMTAVNKTAPVKKSAAVKKPLSQKSVAKKSAANKKLVTKKLAGKKPKKETKSTSELLKAIKAQKMNTLTSGNSNIDSGNQKKSAKNMIPAKIKANSKTLTTLPIVRPMQKAVEIVAPSSSCKKKARKFSFGKRDLALFRIELLMMRDHFAGQTKAMKHDALQRDDEVNSEEDGTDAFMRLQALNQMDDQQHIVSDIDMALTAIEKGTYGTCELCECLISKMRLKARPFAKFCVKCKAEMERLNRFNKPH